MILRNIILLTKTEGKGGRRMFNEVLYVCMYILTGIFMDVCCTTDKHFYTLGCSAGFHCGTMPKISSSVDTPVFCETQLLKLKKRNRFSDESVKTIINTVFTSFFNSILIYRLIYVRRKWIVEITIK